MLSLGYYGLSSLLFQPPVHEGRSLLASDRKLCKRLVILWCLEGWQTSLSFIAGAAVAEVGAHVSLLKAVNFTIGLELPGSHARKFLKIQSSAIALPARRLDRFTLERT